MSDQDIVYGVFRNSDEAVLAVAELHKAGLQTSEICVVANQGESFKYLSGAVQDPNAGYFVNFGIGGCIAGLCAGIAAAPTIPYVVSFQILTPLMAAISGGIVFAYFGCFMCAFLHANKPHHWANVFEGTVESGSVIVLAEPDSAQQKKSVIEILNALDPIELVVRRKTSNPIIAPEQFCPPAEVERVAPALSAVA